MTGKQQKGLFYTKIIPKDKSEMLPNLTSYGIKEILDEAKKEYRAIFNQKWADKETIPEINRILNFKQQEWFKKWFGATKQQ